MTARYEEAVARGLAGALRPPASPVLSSICTVREQLVFLVRGGGGRRLMLATPSGVRPIGEIGRERGPDGVLGGRAWTSRVTPPDHEAAVVVRSVLPRTAPRRLGRTPAFGFGDRLGLATAAHVRAARAAGIAPVLAQQSIREMERTERAPADVLDAATWGVLAEGYAGPFGADADHLKTAADVRRTVAAGFTMFTIDPSEHVRDEADDLPAGELAAAVRSIPGGADSLSRYVGRRVRVGEAEEGVEILLDRETLSRAIVKYLAAIDHVADLEGILAAILGRDAYDLEISVDETRAPTRPADHVWIALELRRRGIRIHGIAPRFPGGFEKGIDFRGDREGFARDLRAHVAIARGLGPYKLSLHSGSDKFAVFPLLARHAPGVAHVKTAGTSYLEALRVVARRDADLFRRILAFALEGYERNRATYAVSGDPARVGDPEAIAEPERLLDQDDARQILHVAYGPVLTARDAAGRFRFRDRLYAVLEAAEADHLDGVEAHMRRHIEALGAALRA